VIVLGAGVAVLAQGARGRQQPPTDGTPAAAAKQNNLKNTLLALDRLLWDTFARHDPEAAERLYAEDFVGFSRDGRSNKRQNVEVYRHFRGVNVKISDVELRRVSSDTAILTYVYSSTVLSRDGRVVQVRRNRRTANCWVQRDGGWVL